MNKKSGPHRPVGERSSSPWLVLGGWFDCPLLAWGQCSKEEDKGLRTVIKVVVATFFLVLRGMEPRASLPSTTDGTLSYG